MNNRSLRRLGWKVKTIRECEPEKMPAWEFRARAASRSIQSPLRRGRSIRFVTIRRASAARHPFHFPSQRPASADILSLYVMFGISNGKIRKWLRRIARPAVWAPCAAHRPASCSLLFEEAFGRENTTVRSYGNVMACIAFLTGMASEELSRQELEENDELLPH